jgi:hypothetical protein
MDLLVTGTAPRARISAVLHEPGHRPPAAPPPAPPRSQGRHQPKSPATFRVTAGRAKFRHPGATPVGDLHPDDTATCPDRDSDRLTGSTRPAVSHTITEKLAHQKGSHIPARVPRPEYAAYERAGDPCPLRPPRKRHGLPDRQPSHHRTRPSPAALPRETGRAAGGRREMHAPLGRERQVGTRPPRTLSVARPSSRPPSVAVRAKPTVPHTAPRPRFPSAMRPWTPQHSALQRDKVTHAGTEKNGPRSREFPAHGLFPQVVAGVGFEPT